MHEKLTKLVPVKLGETMHADLLKVCGGLRSRAGWIRARIAEGIERAKEEQRIGKVTRAEARALVELRKLGLDPEKVLRRAIEDTTEKRAIDRILHE